ncbi:hypothetical protein VF14_32600 [Nostoc linckia z18]|uniref:Uncharacterized protein n=2 Tax=Nostoc linckia TaxID=92942 RepID=A0A9Q5Z7P6_NOSLI|nr:hypothetical protein [Nostoc linckia]PHK33587.1 hypothetical protein VF12_25025 [Nostoc linckia z15]PHK44569.1 hypothetical protein VF13_21435 [Nostoc linckia z16]PHJ59613.1 hypothetical protein VF02_24710 [Nostoc linckia z1]PHJ59905.1 hypothetical protein VF03_33940 [Nostoc linckia z2]PHJ65109.1 hypothetical protein VF05_21440 [Nostoc linckia z3]
MSKTTFVNGTTVTADFLNAINNPTFDGQDLDGHNPKITNDDLSNTAGQIKPEWTTFRDALKVSASSGLSATYTGGAATLPNGAIATITPGTISLTDNATNYIYVNSSGSVVASTSTPLLGISLAKIVTVSGAISGSVVDLRPRFMVSPRQEAVRSFGGSGGEGDYTLSGTATFDQGEYYFQNFTIQAGATLTISGGAHIYVARNATIAGTINVNTPISGGAGFSTSVAGNIGGLSGAGPGGGSGSGTGQAYNYVLTRHGSGGGSGFCSCNASSSGSVAGGGKGGGGLTIEAGGAILVTGAINAKGGNGTSGSIITGTGYSTGGGGGSGGLVLLKSLTSITISATANIDVRGGNGGDGAGISSRGGGAGGGGQVVLISPSNNTSGSTILLSAGADGTDTGTAVGGGAGGGFGGAGGQKGGASASSGQLILRNFIPVG